MSDYSREEYRKKISLEVRNNYEMLIKIMDKEELSDDDRKVVEKITQSTLNIEKQSNVVSVLPTDIISKLNKIVNIVNEKQHLFTYNLKESYTRYSNTLNTYNNSKGKNLIIKNFNSGVGVTRTTLGIVDDVTNFVNEPLLSVNKQVHKNYYGGYIHQTNIDREYQISFEFTLKRFPSKTYQNSDNNFSMKQITSKNTDLITFEYEGDNLNVIEFGAMAPLGVYFPHDFMFEVSDKYSMEVPLKSDSKKVMTLRDILRITDNKPYKNIYSPFSIAASISCGNNHRVSVATDYKFELDKSYLVTLKIGLGDSNGSSGNVGGFGEDNYYQVTMEVNNIQENLSSFTGKIWGRKGNRAKNNNKVPSQPNFRYRCLPKIIKMSMVDSNEVIKVKQMINDRYTYKSMTNPSFYFNGINLTTLKSINTIPYARKEYSKNKLYNKNMIKTNKGVIFKSVDIYCL